MSDLVPLPSAQWHVGPWTEHCAPPGKPGVVGTTPTYHGLLFDIVTLARRRGWLDTTSGEARALQHVEMAIEDNLVGAGAVDDPEIAAVLRTVAFRALGWLDEHAPPGYRFKLRDGALYLNPVLDFTAPVVAVEAVTAAARERGIELGPDVAPPPRAGAAQLACAHVAARDGGWVVHSVPFVLAGPVATLAAAVAVVENARDELAAALRFAGAGDLAATRDRWVPVPVSS